MINRVDRKRPSAVLEDRLGISHIVDLDSSALSYLQLGAGYVEIGHRNNSNASLNHTNQTFNSNPIQIIYDVMTEPSKRRKLCYFGFNPNFTQIR